MLTIAIPCFNSERTISRCIDSVYEGLASHDDFELVIIDNNSQDRTWEILLDYSFKYNNIRLYQRVLNFGPISNFACMYQLSNYDYVLTLAADDYLSPNFITTAISMLDYKYEFFIPGYQNVSDANGELLDKVDISSLQLYNPYERLLSLETPMKSNYAIYSVIKREYLINSLPILNCISPDRRYISELLPFSSIKLLPSIYYKTVSELSFNKRNPETPIYTVSVLKSALTVLSSRFRYYNSSIWSLNQKLCITPLLIFLSLKDIVLIVKLISKKLLSNG